MYLFSFLLLLQVSFPSGCARWFDMPFTREESLCADKSFKINCKFILSFIYNLCLLQSSFCSHVIGVRPDLHQYIVLHSYSLTRSMILQSHVPVCMHIHVHVVAYLTLSVASQNTVDVKLFVGEILRGLSFSRDSILWVVAPQNFEPDVKFCFRKISHVQIGQSRCTVPEGSLCTWILRIQGHLGSCSW